MKDDWWNQTYNNSENPFEKDSFAYCAYAELCSANQLEKQKPFALKSEWALLEESTDPITEREWVGLTDEDIDNLTDKITIKEFFCLIEAKLKEKNNG